MLPKFKQKEAEHIVEIVIAYYLEGKTIYSKPYGQHSEWKNNE